MTTQRTAARAEPARCGIVPPYLLAALAMCDDPDLAVRASRTLEHDTRLRQLRLSPSAPFRTAGPGVAPGSALAQPPGAGSAGTGSRDAGSAGTEPQDAGPAGTEPQDAGSAGTEPQDAGSMGTGPDRTVSDAQNGETLPGEPVRTEGQDPVQDIAVNEAYDGLGSTWSLFAEAFDRDSLDGKGLPLLATVHFGHDYDNAYWDGEQMVFGDGDGRVFGRFTAGVDVIGHELTHGVTEFTAGLRYAGQSGALNESISDVFGILVKQRLLGQSAEESDWLIGADLLLPGVKGVALRSMKDPGTAYDDPALGKDPQPGHLDDYVDTASDNGGVHINSGIPNRAFQLAATAIGGNAWEKAGRIWYAVLTGSIRADCDFVTFAGLSIDAAGELFGTDSAEQAAVRSAWEQVGVIAADTTAGDTTAGDTTVGDGTGDQPAGGRPGEARAADGDTVAVGDRAAGDTAAGDTAAAGERADDAPAGTTGAGQGEGAAPDQSGQPPLGAEVTVRRSGGFAGTTAERTVRLDDLPPAEARQWIAVIEQRSLRQLSGSAPGVDRFVYEVELTGYSSFGGPQRARVAEQDLPADLADLLRRTLSGD